MRPIRFTFRSCGPEMSKVEEDTKTATATAEGTVKGDAGATRPTPRMSHPVVAGQRMKPTWSSSAHGKGVFPRSSNRTKEEIRAAERKRAGRIKDHEAAAMRADFAFGMHTPGRMDDPQNRIDMSAYSNPPIDPYPEVLKRALQDCVVGIVRSVGVDEEQCTHKAELVERPDGSTHMRPATYSHWYARVDILDTAAMFRVADADNLPYRPETQSDKVKRRSDDIAKAGFFACVPNPVRKSAHACADIHSVERFLCDHRSLRSVYMPKSSIGKFSTRLMRFPSWPTAASIPPSIGDLVIGHIRVGEKSNRFTDANFASEQMVNFVVAAQHGIKTTVNPVLFSTRSHLLGDILFVILALLHDNEPKFEWLFGSKLVLNGFHTLDQAVRFVSERVHRPGLLRDFRAFVVARETSTPPAPDERYTGRVHEAVWM